MSRKRNIRKEMFQLMTECVDSLTIDDVTGQAVPESGTGHTECSVADGCKPQLLDVIHKQKVPLKEPARDD